MGGLYGIKAHFCERNIKPDQSSQLTIIMVDDTAESCLKLKNENSNSHILIRSVVCTYAYIA